MPMIKFMRDDAEILNDCFYNVLPMRESMKLRLENSDDVPKKFGDFLASVKNGSIKKAKGIGPATLRYLNELLDQYYYVTQSEGEQDK